MTAVVCARCGSTVVGPHLSHVVKEDWKPKDLQRDLVRAGALLAAEVDRGAS